LFGKILHANDGSEHAFRALALALAIAKQNRSDLHIVCVEEIPYLPEFMEEVRESTGTAARYFHGVLQRARSMRCARQSRRQRHRQLDLVADLERAIAGLDEPAFVALDKAVYAAARQQDATSSRHQQAVGIRCCCPFPGRSIFGH
jgi:nucleotide-binding universal stress UspA family protein